MIIIPSNFIISGDDAWRDQKETFLRKSNAFRKRMPGVKSVPSVYGERNQERKRDTELRWGMWHIISSFWKAAIGTNECKDASSDRNTRGNPSDFRVESRFRKGEQVIFELKSLWSWRSWYPKLDVPATGSDSFPFPPLYVLLISFCLSLSHP